MKQEYRGIKVGDTIYIKSMKGEPQYDGKSGIVESIDDIGQLHGTWGGLAVNLDEDNVVVNYIE